jgi:hypothetical protein
VKCVNCGHCSFVKSNFKLTSSGKAFCVKKCLEVYKDYDRNLNARREGDKPE